MIDLHIHILPGLDDGAAGLVEALEMCRLCVEDGVSTVAATPHIIREVYENRRENILEAVQTLSDSLRKHGIPLRILPGADVRLDYDLVERLDSRELCTINDGNRFLLLEFPDVLHGSEYTRLIAGLKKRGVYPILSHPERNPFFYDNVEALYDLVYSNVLLQVTARSLMGGFGREIRRFSERLLEHRMVHLLASDAHAPDVRPPGLRAAYERASELIGEEDAKCLVQDNPALILQGKLPDVYTPLPWKRAKRSWWPFRG